MFVYELLRRIRDTLIKINRDLRNKMLRGRLTNQNPTIISNNCVAGVMYHDLGLRFSSPTINLYILPDDYVKFINNMQHYLSLDVVDAGEHGSDEGRPFPIGIIDDIKIYFMHYKNFAEAREKWNERKKRVNYDNLFVIWAPYYTDGFSEKHMLAFESLRIKNKMLIWNKQIAANNVYYIKGFDNERAPGHVMGLMHPKVFAKRYYEQIDYVSFLNGKVKPRG